MTSIGRVSCLCKNCRRDHRRARSLVGFSRESVSRCNSSDFDLDLGSGGSHCTINGCELSDLSFSFFTMFLDNVSTSIPCISTYDIFSLYHESYPAGTNTISPSVSSSIPVPSPPQQKAPLKQQKQRLSPTLPSSSTHPPYSAEWIHGRIHEDPSLALRP